MVEMLTVWARSPPVPTTSSAVGAAPRAAATGAAFASMVSTRPASSAGVSPLARSGSAKPAICAGVACAGHDLAHRPGGVLGAQRLAAQQPGRAPTARCAADRTAPGHGRGPTTGRPAARGPGRAAAARPSPRRPPGPAGGRCVASASAQVASQRSSRRPSSTQIAGQSSISFFSCRLMPMPPVGCASPSRIATSTPPASIRATTSAPGGALDPVDAPQVGGRAPADGRADLIPHGGVLAEDDHGGGRGRSGHGRDPRTRPGRPHRPTGTTPAGDLRARQENRQSDAGRAAERDQRTPVTPRVRGPYPGRLSGVARPPGAARRWSSGRSS